MVDPETLYPTAASVRQPSSVPGYLTGFAVLLLVFITPFGNESTSAWAVLVHRTLLLGTVAICLTRLRNRETLDFGIGIYALAAPAFS